MEIPDVVQAELGDEDIYAGVSIGNEDVLCLTPTRVLVYRSEGILSDEHVETYSHDVERLSMSEGRRKTKFGFEYVDGEKTLKVPANRTDAVLEHLLEAVLRVAGVIDDGESIAGAFRFSELTLIITDARVVKRIGNAVWDADDFEVYPYDEVTGLEFERGSVATQFVIEVRGRPQRIKAPSDDAPMVKQLLKQALFDYYEVGTLEELNDAITEDAGGAAEDDESDGGSNIDFGSGIDPLVSGGDEGSEREGHEQDPLAPDTVGSTPDEDPSERDEQSGASGTERGASQREQSAGSRDAADANQSEQDRAQRETVDDPTEGDGTARSSREEHHGSSPQGGHDQQSPDRDDTERASGEHGSSEPADDDAPPSDVSTPESDPAADQQARSDASRADDAESSRTESSTDASTGDDDSEEKPRSGEEPSLAEVAGLDEMDDDADHDETITRDDLQALTNQVAELTETVERQNEMLQKQHRAIRYLLEELGDE